MKKIISTLFLVILILVGCQTDTSLGITSLDRVNLEVEKMISFEDNLQFIHYEMIVVYVNGEMTPFDTISI